MARILFPTRFADQAQLINKIASKHTADAGTSILTPFFTENEIVIADDVDAVTDAQVAHTVFEQNWRNAEKMYKERDRLFDANFKKYRRMVQYLKTFYANNIGKLGDWGINVNGRKIAYLPNINNRFANIHDFITKHNSYPAGTSPLEAFLAENTNSDIDLDAMETTTNTAKSSHDNAAELNADKETQRAQRDLLMAVPLKNMALTGNFLMNHFNANPNKAGDWGFTVDTSPKGTRVRTGFVNIGSDKVLANLAVGGVLVNNSEHNILIYKGKTATGTPVTLAPGKPLLLTTGYGTLTVRNPDDEIKAIYQGVFNR